MNPLWIRHCISSRYGLYCFTGFSHTDSFDKKGMFSHVKFPSVLHQNSKQLKKVAFSVDLFVINCLDQLD